jgi:uncharacterized membrane protein YkoI
MVTGTVLASMWACPLVAQANDAALRKQARVTKQEAERIALAGVLNGKIKSAELEKEQGLLIWSFDIAKPGTKNLTEVWVDAKTGKIASLKVETPKDQAKEAAADKAKK